MINKIRLVSSTIPINTLLYNLELESILPGDLNVSDLSKDVEDEVLLSDFLEVFIRRCKKRRGADLIQVDNLSKNLIRFMRTKTKKKYLKLKKYIRKFSDDT